VAFVVQLTDTHLRLGPEGPAAREALDAAVAAVLELTRTPDVVLVTGDLADTGHPDEYADVQAALAPITAPVYVLPGNHDDRAVLEAHFDAPETVAIRRGRIVLCDTTIPGEAGGRLDTEWLAAQLAAEPDTPTIVAMHHPPLFTGIPALDAIGMAEGDRERLATVLAASPQVLRVISGHVHRPTFETLAGCGVLTSPSTHIQIEPDPGPEGMRFVTRGRAIMLHHLRDSNVISHIQPT
jgi:3',5'-cyclic AMP phosphodiesterase CpdA